MLPGVYKATKKDGRIYYRSNITYHGKHISLGSFSCEREANEAYCLAEKILYSDLSLDAYLAEFIECEEKDKAILAFEKGISLINFRDHDMYIGNPIYLYKNYFSYFLSPEEEYKFDIDDLFYYSSHKILKRQGHLYVNDFGMQVTLFSRYGIKNHAVPKRDYDFANGDPFDFRYSNIMIINSYYGVMQYTKNARTKYKARIHINGNYTLGNFSTAEKAAIAYNKAVDLAKKAGIDKKYPENYLDGMSPSEYADIYTKIKISKKYLDYLDTVKAIQYN